MTTNYPNNQDNSTNLPGVSGSTEEDIAISALRGATFAIEKELGITPSGVYSDVRARFDILEARINNPVSPTILSDGYVNSPLYVVNTPSSVTLSISVGTGVPTENRVDGSLYMRTDGAVSQGLYSRRGGVWKQIVTDAYKMPNNQFLLGRNVNDSSDIQLIGADNLNRIKIGSNSGDLSYMPGNLIVDGYLAHSGSTVSTIGFIREQNNTTIVGFRNAASNNNIAALSSNASNNIILGDAVNAGTIHNTATNGLHAFQVNSTGFLEIGHALTGAETPFDTSAFIRFSQAAPAPTIGQARVTASSTNGQSMTIQSQNATGVTSVGGALNLSSGTGTSADGYLNLQNGNVTKLSLYSTVLATALEFSSTAKSPNIIQSNTAVASATGAEFIIQSQSASGATSNGGSLKLMPGTGTATDGYVSIFGGAAEAIRTITNKVIFTTGVRNKATAVTTTPYTILNSDRFLLVNTDTLTITVNLPTSPTLGDTYTVKDSTGAAATRNITVSGNGTNIEGVASTTISTNYGRVQVIYNGTQWVQV